MVEKNKLRPFLFKVRYVYILAYVLFVTLNKFIPFGMVVSDSVGALTYSGLAVFGAGLLAVDFLTKRDMFRTRYNGLLVLFYVVYVLSMLYNIRYGWVDNAKTLVWMLIQTFLLMAADPEQTEENHGKWMDVIFDGFVLLWTVGVVVSLGQYVTQYYMPHVTSTGDSTPVGFLGGRLYGVFTDPNVAAVCSIIALLLSIFRLKNRKNGKIRKVCAWTAVVLNVMYVILSGSRTGEMIMLTVAVVTAVFACIKKVYSHGVKWYAKAGRSALLVILSVVLTFGGMRVVKEGLAYVPSFYSRIFSGSTEVERTEDGELVHTPVDKTDLSRPDVVHNEDFSNARFRIWKDAFTLAKASPVVGTSPRNHLAFAEDRFGKDLFMVQRQYSVHNVYLALLTYTGILGAVIMLTWLGCIVVHIMRYLIRRRKTQDRYYTPVMYLSLVLIAVAVSAFPMMGIFFGNSVIEVLFWLILGYVLYMIRMSEQAQGIKEPLTYRLFEGVVKKFGKKRTK